MRVRLVRATGVGIASLSMGCSQLCTSNLDCMAGQSCSETGCTPAEPFVDLDGWDDAPGQRVMLLAERFTVLGSASADRCSGYPGYCTALGRANLEAGSDARLRGFMEGPAKLLVEIGGLDLPSEASEEQVTVKLYDLSALEPCVTVADGQIDRAQAITRLRADLRGGLVVSTSTSVWVAHLGAQLRLERLQVRLELLERRTVVRVDLLASLPAVWLGSLANPHCDGVNTLCRTYPVRNTVLEALRNFEDLDVDLDEPSNGLERVRLGSDGLLRECMLEDYSVAPGRDCSSRLSDGYSSAHSFRATLMHRRFCPP